MRVAKGPRPWPVWAYVMSGAMFAFYNLIHGLTYLETSQFIFEGFLPEIEWNRDLVIVAVSARFTIAMIPVVAIWFLASRIARVLAVLMWLQSMPGGIYLSMSHIESESPVWTWPIWWLVGFGVLVLILFLPQSNRWFKTKGESDADAFA